MAVLFWLGLAFGGFVALIVALMVLGYIVENRTGAGGFLLGALLGAILMLALHRG